MGEAVMPSLDAEEMRRAVSEAQTRWRDSGAIGDLVRLRDARVRAGASITAPEGRPAPAIAAAPPQRFDPAPGALPEIDLRDLDIETLRSAMHHHGALIIRNFLTPQQALGLREDVDAVLAEAVRLVKAAKAGVPLKRSANEKANFHPFAKDSEMAHLRSGPFAVMSGAVETLLSPRVSNSLLDIFEANNMRSLMQDYFGEEPCLSFQKSLLRRVQPLPHEAEWHQDGAFMGEGIASLNIWVALSECGAGTDSPGMDLVPKRLTHIIPPGQDGAKFEWSVSGATVAREFDEAPIARPHFAAGDVVLFDHFNLHATSSGAEFTRQRYAIETWFFASSRAAVNQRPVFW